MDNVVTNLNNEDSPFTLFEVDDVVYGLSSANVLSIEILGVPTPVVNLPDYSMGILDFRGEIIPLIGLRKLFGGGARGAGLRGFMQKLIADHKQWMLTLEQSAEDGVVPALVFDPHACALGVWLDTFTSDSNSLSAQVQKIHMPHKLLHEGGETVAKLIQAKRLEDAMDEVKKLKSTHFRILLGLLGNTVDAYVSSIRDMMLVLNVGDVTKGIVVDNIVSVEYINKFLDLPEGNSKSEYIKGLAKRDKDNSTVLLLDETRVISL